MRDCIKGKASFLGLLAALPLAVLAGTEVYMPLGSANAIAVVDADSDRVVAEIPDINASHGLAVSLVAWNRIQDILGGKPWMPSLA